MNGKKYGTIWKDKYGRVIFTDSEGNELTLTKQQIEDRKKMLSEGSKI